MIGYLLFVFGSCLMVLVLLSFAAGLFGEQLEFGMLGIGANLAILGLPLTLIGAFLTQKRKILRCSNCDAITERA